MVRACWHLSGAVGPDEGDSGVEGNAELHVTVKLGATGVSEAEFLAHQDGARQLSRVRKGEVQDLVLLGNLVFLGAMKQSRHRESFFLFKFGGNKSSDGDEEENKMRREK